MKERFVETIAVGDELAEVSRVQELLSALWESRGLPPDQEPTVSLMLEEVLSNVIRHGRSEGRPPEIVVEFSGDGTAFECEVSDGAAFFDPLAHPEPDVSAPIEKRRPGGLGIFMVKRLADEVTYERRDGRNHLWFRKRLGPAEDG